MKTTSYGKPGRNNSFLKSDLRHGEVQGYPILPTSQARKLNIRRELGDVGVRGGPVPRLHNECCRTSNLTSKMNFLGQVYHVKWFSLQKVKYLQRTWTCSKPGRAWKPSWAYTWSWPCPEKNFEIFFSKYQIRHNARSPRERTAYYVNICPRKGGCQKRQ